MKTETGTRQAQLMTLLLDSESGLSIDELAAKLGISRNAVKQHLVVLEKRQQVFEAHLSNTGGRPARIYALTQDGIQQFPKQYAWFCNLLLDELAADLYPDAFERLMWNMGVKLATSLLPQFTGLTAIQKQQALVELMQNLGYHAELRHEDGQAVIRASHCVYHDLALKHPALCQFDKALMATLLNAPVAQTHCMARKDCDCRFNLGKD
ncbi:MAG: HTH domain-containing protein [Methylomonas sp.]|nr:HTH domain-containing protein [Methylomonas sp.]PPD20880.1 MAG: ArsR family transcriptional regulator [Methylomonas sp.]PPD26332.1 MAG: ArsR family transcriptional regulator [Methylomonas sp.]PPD38053.1 MAG: ArsR family transcriptional regulator [Methylomonas sp.]PPD40312.1 MAG: ArsR family transcriptional regulator [Methylomonas sp.]